MSKFFACVSLNKLYLFYHLRVLHFAYFAFCLLQIIFFIWFIITLWRFLSEKMKQLRNIACVQSRLDRSNYQATFRLPKIILIWVHLCLLKSCSNKGNKILCTNVFWEILVPQKNDQSGVRNSENWVENALVFLCSTESLFVQGNAFFTLSFMLRKWNLYTM